MLREIRRLPAGISRVQQFLQDRQKGHLHAHEGRSYAQCPAKAGLQRNVQLGVEGKYITGLLASSKCNDLHTMIPFLENMEKHLGREYEDITTDAGYKSEENCTYVEGKTAVCYIKPQSYEHSETKKFKNNMALRENMACNANKYHVKI